MPLVLTQSPSLLPCLSHGKASGAEAAEYSWHGICFIGFTANFYRTGPAAPRRGGRRVPLLRFD